ncbi:hypothetical protein AB835_10600 [Candidatus Endobugula sertula]|uniref:Uncharacterized protein n=1 Tax=Candidatus Endobugula sertula TaxID=62101 RepID=A0A1D2QND6_9GAMM|nr:hypothetical protein AB835_10600 [Candidatus Endobugula sertula]
MGIINSLDSQSFQLTRKLLEHNAPYLAYKLGDGALQPHKYPLDEITVELEIETINAVIDELMVIGQRWLEDNINEYHSERKQILAYILQQWVKVGQDVQKLAALPSNNVLH